MVHHRCLSYNAGEEFTVRLYENEVFYVSTLADLTGTLITASDPVAVFAGNSRTAIPSTAEPRDHLVEQVRISSVRRILDLDLVWVLCNIVSSMMSRP